MERRSHKRIPASIKVNFGADDMKRCGTVMNLSEKGMFISTRDMDFPFHSRFNVAFPLEDRMLTIPVAMRRLLRSGDTYNGMGVEIVVPPQEYLAFVNNHHPG